MLKTRPVVVALVASMLGARGAAFASGYSIYEQGANAMAQAGAFSARASDPSALFFNPAGILQLDGKRIYGGSTAIFLTGSRMESATSGTRFDQESNIAWPSSLYYTQKISDRAAWGLGITSPFGLKTEWGPTFDGRFISRESNIAVENINANLAFRLNPTWSAAIGFDYAKAQIRELSKNIDLGLVNVAFTGQQAFTKLTGDGHDTGYNLALRWASENGWRWGGSYRSSMKPTIDGDIEFQEVPVALAAAFPNGGASAELPLPATLATGLGFVSHKGRGKWEAEADLVWTDWSAFRHLRIDIENNTAAVADVDNFEGWHDTYSIRAGFAYHFRPRQDWRVGVYFDQNPIPDQHVRPRLPDADRKSIQVGYGFHSKGGFVLDIAYQALFFNDRRAEGNPNSATDPVQPGLYSSYIGLLGASLGWTF
jgi:long-chain fatty acid transport protein